MFLVLFVCLVMYFIVNVYLVMFEMCIVYVGKFSALFGSFVSNLLFMIDGVIVLIVSVFVVYVKNKIFSMMYVGVVVCFLLFLFFFSSFSRFVVASNSYANNAFDIVNSDFEFLCSVFMLVNIFLYCILVMIFVGIVVVMNNNKNCALKFDVCGVVCAFRRNYRYVRYGVSLI